MKSLKQVLKRGVDYEDHPEWFQFFQFELARVLTKEGREEEAIDALLRGLHNAEKNNSGNVTVWLFPITSHNLRHYSNLP